MSKNKIQLKNNQLYKQLKVEKEKYQELFTNYQAALQREIDLENDLFTVVDELDAFKAVGHTPPKLKGITPIVLRLKKVDKINSTMSKFKLPFRI